MPLLLPGISPANQFDYNYTDIGISPFPALGVNPSEYTQFGYMLKFEATAVGSLGNPDIMSNMPQVPVLGSGFVDGLALGGVRVNTNGTRLEVEIGNDGTANNWVDAGPFVVGETYTIFVTRAPLFLGVSDTVEIYINGELFSSSTVTEANYPDTRVRPRLLGSTVSGENYTFHEVAFWWGTTPGSHDIESYSEEDQLLLSFDNRPHDWWRPEGDGSSYYPQTEVNQGLQNTGGIYKDTILEHTEGPTSGNSMPVGLPIGSGAEEELNRESELRLDLVNRVLANVQEPCVSAVDANTSSKQAEQYIDEVNKAVQSNSGRGWWFNTDPEQTWSPGPTQYITVAEGVINFRPDALTDGTRPRLIARYLGNTRQLYDLDDNTFEFENDVEVTNVVTLLPLIDLPVEAIDLIVSEASREFYAYRKGGRLSQAIERVHMEHKRRLNRAHNHNHQ